MYPHLAAGFTPRQTSEAHRLGVCYPRDFDLNPLPRLGMELFFSEARFSAVPRPGRGGWMDWWTPRAAWVSDPAAFVTEGLRSPEEVMSLRSMETLGQILRRSRRHAPSERLAAWPLDLPTRNALVWPLSYADVPGTFLKSPQLSMKCGPAGGKMLPV